MLPECLAVPHRGTPTIDLEHPPSAVTTLSSTDLRGVRNELVAHAGGGLLVLLVIATLSVFKPWGRTRYGQRVARAASPNAFTAVPQGADTRTASDERSLL